MKSDFKEIGIPVGVSRMIHKKLNEKQVESSEVKSGKDSFRQCTDEPTFVNTNDRQEVNTRLGDENPARKPNDEQPEERKIDKEKIRTEEEERERNKKEMEEKPRKEEEHVAEHAWTEKDMKEHALNLFTEVERKLKVEKRLEELEKKRKVVEEEERFLRKVLLEDVKSKSEAYSKYEKEKTKKQWWDSVGETSISADIDLLKKNGKKPESREEKISTWMEMGSSDLTGDMGLPDELDPLTNLNEYEKNDHKVDRKLFKEKSTDQSNTNPDYVKHNIAPFTNTTPGKQTLPTLKQAGFENIGNSKQAGFENIGNTSTRFLDHTLKKSPGLFANENSSTFYDDFEKDTQDDYEDPIGTTDNTKFSVADTKNKVKRPQDYVDQFTVLAGTDEVEYELPKEKKQNFDGYMYKGYSGNQGEDYQNGDDDFFMQSEKDEENAAFGENETVGSIWDANARTSTNVKVENSDGFGQFTDQFGQGEKSSFGPTIWDKENRGGGNHSDNNEGWSQWF